MIQLILYKKYFAEQFGLAEESIDIEYIIAKRKVPEDAEFASMKQRIQNFQPPSKSKHIKEATKKLKKFINEAFDYNGYKETFHVPRPSKWNCHFCAFKEDDKLCNVLGKNL